MISRLKYVVKYLLQLDQAGRNFSVFPDDTFLVSYPKSGNTWCRFLLANLIYPGESVSFANINRLIAAPGVASKKFLGGLSRPRVLKSHEPFDVRYRKVIYVVRDPRDVVVSEYYFEIKKLRLDAGVSLEQYVKRFVAGETASYGSWWEHVASWLAARQGSSSFLLVRYEDLLSDTLRQMSRLAEFLAIDAGSERLRVAVERSSVDRMRSLEKQESDLWTGTKDTRKEIPFVRSAKSGGWKQALSPHSVEEIESAWFPLMNWLGYPLESPRLESSTVPAWARSHLRP